MENREAYANLLLPKLLADRDITGRDAALATELAYGTLRGQGTYDAVLAACSDRPLDKLDPPVRQILRLGAHQLLATRIGAHAAVATSVDLAKQVVGPRVSGYVNAVLRRVATRDLDAWLAIVAPDPAADADGNLAVRYSYPRWIVAAYRAALARCGRRRARGRPGRGQRAPQGHHGHPPRRPGPRPGDAGRRRARPLVPLRLHPRLRQPGRSDRLRPGRRPRRSQPAGRHRADPRSAGTRGHRRRRRRQRRRQRQRQRQRRLQRRGRRTLARPVRGPRRQVPPAAAALGRRSPPRAPA